MFWNSVAHELPICFGLQPLLVARWGWPFNDIVTVSDACPSGYAAYNGQWPVSSVRHVYSYSERWRVGIPGRNPDVRENVLHSFAQQADSRTFAVTDCVRLP